MISLSSDKSLVVSSTGNGILYSDKSGKTLWGYNTKGNVTTVSVSPNGLFVSICTGDDLLLLNKQGQLLWDSKINQTSICAALVSTDSGYVLAGDALSGETGRLYLFDKNGYQIWNHIDTYENQRQAITPDGQYESAIVGESQRGFGLDVSFNKMEYVVVPEFPFAIPILLIGITSLTVFYRMKLGK
jgi:outer membrane protein assembly factor BamB